MFCSTWIGKVRSKLETLRLVATSYQFLSYRLLSQNLSEGFILEHRIVKRLFKSG